MLRKYLSSNFVFFIGTVANLLNSSQLFRQGEFYLLENVEELIRDYFFKVTSLSTFDSLLHSSKMPGPPPPPPPMMAPVKKAFVPAATKTANGGDNRNALLASIQKGAQLKKVKTVDKSAPIGAGKIAGEPTSSVPRSKVVTTSTKTSPDTSSSSPVSGKKPGGFANLTDELQFKLTLKKNKSSPSKEPISYSEPKEVST